MLQEILQMFGRLLCRSLLVMMRGLLQLLAQLRREWTRYLAQSHIAVEMSLNNR